MSDAPDLDRDLDALADAAADAAGDAVTTLHQCPACGGSRFRRGLDTVLPAGRHVFVPSEASLLSNGYTVHAAVCLDCGHLRHYLLPKDVVTLRKL